MGRNKVPRSEGGLAGPAAIYILAAAANAAIPFLILPLIARWLGPTDFGVVGSFVAIVNVLVLLVGLNAYGFVGVGYFRDGAHLLPRLVGAALLIILVTGALIGIAMAAGARLIEDVAGIDRTWLWTLPAAAIGQAIIAVALAVAQTIKKPLAYATIQVGYGLLLGISALFLIGFIGMDWSGRALGQAAAALMVATCAILWLAWSDRITLSVGRNVTGQALAFGIPLLPHSLAAVAMASMDRLALAGDNSEDVVGYYFLALQISSVITALAAAVNQAWVPWLYARLANNDQASWKEIKRVLCVGGPLLAAAAISIALLAKFLVALVGGEQFSPAVVPLRILSFYAAFQAWYMLISAFLFYAKRSGLLSILTTSSALLQGLLIFLLLQWGAPGVAAALAATALVSASVISVVAYRLALAHRSAGPVAAQVAL